jgi:hypothetical protein
LLETIVGKASREIASTPALMQKLERCHTDCSECALFPSHCTISLVYGGSAA